MGIITIKKKTATRFGIKEETKPEISKIDNIWSEGHELIIKLPSGQTIRGYFADVDVWDINDTEGTVYESIGELCDALETLGLANFKTPGASGQNIVLFEIQLTQSGTSAPNIVNDSIIGAMGANISTTYNSDGDYYIVADLPIFANVKEFVKNSMTQKTSVFISYSGLGYYGVSVLYIDDYTIRVQTFQFVSGDPYQINDVMKEPTLIQIPFKP